MPTEPAPDLGKAVDDLAGMRREARTQAAILIATALAVLCLLTLALTMLGRWLSG